MKSLRQIIGIGALTFLGIEALTLGIRGCSKHSKPNPEDKDIAHQCCVNHPGFAKEQLEAGYLELEKITFEIRDLDLNGKYETVLNYNGHHALVKFDEATQRLFMIPYERRIQILEKEVPKAELEVIPKIMQETGK